MKEKILPKDKRAMLLAPNPKACTQYKRKEEKKIQQFFQKTPKRQGGCAFCLKLKHMYNR
jgi:hypothetical protein